MNVLQQIIKSLYSPKDMAKYRFQGIGKTIFYVFLLSFISIIPTTYYFTTAITNGLEVTKKALQHEVPPFVIENGQLSFDHVTPVIIEKDHFKIILDASNTIDKEDLNQSENTIALLKEDFLFIAGGEQQTYSYSMFSDMKITNQKLVEFLKNAESLKWIFLPILILIIFIFTSGIKFIEVSILAMFGLGLKNLVNKSNIQYRHLWRLAAYSITLPTIFFAIMSLLKTQVPSGFLINWFVSIVVLALIIKEIPGKK
ncbi:DUF1189 domain-containing protein [Neobacillus sp. D3-1R]|uniref:DUF1189 domain-containing protein n=1 Tax=Neobacillus sp. D3-1R TaxID=3445778 RepID=UPI003F9ED733